MDRRAWWATGPQGRKESDTTDHPRTWSTGWDGICNRNLPVLSGLILINPNKHLLRTYYIQEKAMTPHSSTLPWRIPWTEERGRLRSMGLQRVGHDWATSLSFQDMWYLFFATWLIPLSITPSKSIQVVSNGRISFFSWLSSSSLYFYCIIFIHSSINANFMLFSYLSNCK